MVGAPVSYSGNQPQPHPPIGGNPAGFYADNTQRNALATPNASISILLPYNGQAPQSASQPGTYPAPGYGITTNPPNSNYPPTPHPSNLQHSNSYPPVSAPPPFPPHTANNQYPPSSMGQPCPPYNSGYPPTSSPFTNTYPPNTSGMNLPQPNQYANAPCAYPPAGYPPQSNNPQPPCGYSQGQSTGTYPPGPATSAYPPGNPTGQAPNELGTYSYPAPQSSGGLYPPGY